MRITKVTKKSSRITADAGKYLTAYKDDVDIVYFTASTTYLVPNTRIENYREITEEEYASYMEMKELALANQNEEEPQP